MRQLTTPLNFRIGAELQDDDRRQMVSLSFGRCRPYFLSKTNIATNPAVQPSSKVLARPPCETFKLFARARPQKFFEPQPVNCNSPYPLHREIVTQSTLLLGIVLKINYRTILYAAQYYIKLMYKLEIKMNQNEQNDEIPKEELPCTGDATDITSNLFAIGAWAFTVEHACNPAHVQHDTVNYDIPPLTRR